jgi:hypothetical protein
MPSSLEWPRSLSLKIPSILASPTVSSSQIHVSTVVYADWPVSCIAVSLSMLIRTPDKADWGWGWWGQWNVSGFLQPLAYGPDPLICCLWNSQGVSPAGMGIVVRYWLLLGSTFQNNLSIWSWDQGVLILRKIETETRSIIRMHIINYRWQANGVILIWFIESN